MIESIYTVYNQSIEMIKIVTFIAITIPLIYYSLKLSVKLVKSIFHKD
jgi:hypothetical protein